MSDSPPPSHQAKLESVLADYLRAAEAGHPLDEQALLSSHPDLAAELKSFFTNRAALERLVEPMQGAAYERTVGHSVSGEQHDADRIRYFGDYELLEEIARGGMGVVYRARQVSLNRVVAVKMMLAGTLADESAVRRFRQEAEAAAKLDHPHIVPVFEVGEHHGQQYFSMGLVEGKSLAAKLLGGPLPPREAAELIEQVARAVQYAHEQGVIHRDLKPANVLLDGQGRPRVTDFGLAKLASREQSLTETGQMLGTPGYMPPEQVDGKPVGPQADVYGLGAILYALLAGRPPFQAATPMETMLQVLSAEPVAPRTLNPSIPRDLDTIVRKSLEKWPEWRYASAAELADELQRFLTGEPIRARRRGVVEQGVRWIARQRRSVLTAAAAAIVSALLIVGSIFGTLAYRKALEGNLKLETNHERLVATLFDDRDRQIVEPFTVPTEQPIALTERTYRLRVGGKNMLSEDFAVRLDRGGQAKHELSLDWQQLWPEQAIGTSRTAGTGGSANWYLVHCRGRDRPAHLLVLDAEHALEPTIELRDPAAGGKVWSVKPERPPELKFAKERWLDSQGGSYHYEPSGIGQTDFRPYVLPTAPQLDGDQKGMGDILIALRHQPALFAFSSEDGRLLWCYAATLPESPDLTPRGNATWFGTVVGEPQVVADLDDDGVSDLIACLLVLEAGAAEKPLAVSDRPRRTIDAVSGKTGKRIWQYELDDRWFDLPKGVEIPLASRWFAAPPYGGTSGSDWIAPHGNIFRNFVYRIGGDGDQIFRQSPPLLLREQGRSLLACVAGTRVVTLEVKTGQPTASPHDLSFTPVRPPQVADVNGDGNDDLVLVERVGDSTFQTFMHAAIQRTPPRQRLWCWSTSRQQPLWTPIEQSADYEKHVQLNQPPPAWPLVADLNGDGRMEIIAPDGTSTNFGPTPMSDRNTRAWGELQMIDGLDGKERWRSRLQTVDQQVDQLIVGPDIDGDGWRDIFAATLFGREVNVRPPQLYIDAISGRDGRPLWHSARPLRGFFALEEVFVDVLNWWNAGPDGWPQLVVSVRLGGGALGGPIALACYSSGSGRLTHESTTLDRPLVADGDGDGVDDLFCFTPRYRPTADRGGKLFSFRGTSPRVWRRLGGDWQAGRDYDGDGFDDVVAQKMQNIPGSPSLVTLSGRTGRELYRTPVETPTWGGAIIRPLDVDLDGDGVYDLLTTDNQRGSDGETPPILAYSGKTGRCLWQPTFVAGTVQQTLFVDAIDLEADGKLELIYVAELSFQGADGSPPSNTNTPVWLVVLDGRTGILRWKQKISEGSGRLAGDTIYQPDLRLAVADLNADGVADIVTPAFLIGLQLELRAYDGRAGSLLWQRETSQQQGSGTGTHWFSWKRTPIPLAEDLDGDGSSEVAYIDYVDQGKAAYRLTVIDGDLGETLWSHQISGAGANWPWHDRPRPLAVSVGQRQRGIVYWNWDSTTAVGEVGGEVVVLRADGTEYWRFPRTAGNNRFSPLLRTADLNRDGREELILFNGDGMEALDIATRERLWRHECPPSVQATIRSIVTGDKSQPPIVELLSGRTMLGLSATDGRSLWTCAGLPREFMLQQPPDNFAQRLGSADKRFPPAFLCEVSFGAGDTVCLQTEPAVGTAIESMRLAPTAHLSPDPRFVRLLPWQVIHFGWPINSPAWLALGLFLYLPALIVLPVWSLYKIVWLRRWSLRFWLLVPVVVSLVAIALTTPAPPTVPAMPTLQARFVVSLLMLPIVAFPWQIGAWLCAGRTRRAAWWLGLTLAMGGLIGALIYTIHWRLTPSDESWVFDATWSLPFLGGLYLTSAISVLISLLEHCAWKPVVNYVRTRRASQRRHASPKHG